MERTLVLGLDGATFTALEELFERGVMPNLRKLYEQGAAGALESTTPPVTGPAWLSLATGMSPGITGIYDFIRNDPARDDFHFTHFDSSVFRGRSVWDYLGDAGLRVGVLDYPMLSPPYEIPGFMLSGGLGSAGFTTYPEDLEKDLENLEKPSSHLNLRDDRYEDLQIFYDEIVENLERRARILNHALQTEEWDFAWAVIQEPDWLQHVMWKCFDKSHPEYSTVSSSERELFVSFWKQVDDVIGKLTKAGGQDTNIFVQSDHGFGPMFDKSFRLNTWLIQEGYLSPKTMGSSQFRVKKGIRRTLSRLARAAQLKKWAPGLFSWGRDKTSSLAIQLNAIDMAETEVFEPGHIGSMGGLYINDAVVPEAHRSELEQELKSKLEAFGTEHNLGLTVVFPEEVYGKKTDGSPDLIVRAPGIMIEDGGWSEPIIDNRPDRLSHQNGSHRKTGILIADGPDIKSTEVTGARVWDITPTLLHAYNLPIPEYMDGDVLTELLVTEREISYSTKHGGEHDGETVEEGVKEQLADLGYFE